MLTHNLCAFCAGSRQLSMSVAELEARQDPKQELKQLIAEDR